MKQAFIEHRIEFHFHSAYQIDDRYFVGQAKLPRVDISITSTNREDPN